MFAIWECDEEWPDEPFPNIHRVSPLLTRPHFFFLLDHKSQSSMTYLGHESNECLKTVSKVNKLVVAYAHIKHARLLSAPAARLRCIVLNRFALLRKSCIEGGCCTETYRRIREQQCCASFPNLQAT